MMNNNNSKVDGLILLALQVILLSFPVLLYYLDPVLYVSFVTDDQFGEFATFVAYGLASLLLAVCFLKCTDRRRRIWFGAIGVLAFLISMEEISWGQRILHIKSPEFFKTYNVQGELGFHNIQAISPDALTYYVVAAAVFLYALLPVAYKNVAVVRRFFDWLALPLSSLALMPILIGTAFFLGLSNLVKSDELGEYFMSLSVLLLSAQWLSQTEIRLPRKSVVSLVALLVVFVTAESVTAAFGSTHGLILRWHSTAERMIDRGHNKPALSIMQYVDAHEEFQRPGTPSIFARALQANGREDEAREVLAKAANKLQASVEAHFDASQALLLADLYVLLGNTDNARSLRQQIITQMDDKIGAAHLENDDLATQLLTIADVQRTLNENEAAVDSLLTAARAARTAVIASRTEHGLGTLANLCRGPSDSDDERIIPIDAMQGLQAPDWAEFCERADRY